MVFEKRRQRNPRIELDGKSDSGGRGLGTKASRPPGNAHRVARIHFEHYRRRLTIFTKGEKVREVPIPSKPFWFDLERLLVELEAKPNDYLMCRQKTIPRAGVRQFPDKPLSGHGMHSWWYRCDAKAGVVPEGTTSGERMHKARHTAGQRVLDATGNLKAVQKLSGTHRSRPPAMCTPIGTSSSSPRRWSAC